MHATIDPECNYCPQCGDEYRAEIRTCAACALELVSGTTLLDLQAERRSASRPLTISPDEPVVTVRKGPLLQIKALRAYLLDRGLPSLMVTEEGGACGCRGPEPLLQVREVDLPEVVAALSQEYRQSTALADHDGPHLAGTVYDAGAAETVCPACGCRFATTSTVCPDCGLCFA